MATKLSTCFCSPKKVRQAVEKEERSSTFYVISGGAAAGYEKFD